MTQDFTASRHRLSNRRASETISIEVNGLAYVATFSRFADGRIAEIFLSNHKSGSQVDIAARNNAIVASLAMQHGVGLETLRNSLLRDARSTLCRTRRYRSPQGFLT